MEDFFSCLYGGFHLVVYMEDHIWFLVWRISFSSLYGGSHLVVLWRISFSCLYGGFHLVVYMEDFI